ncbi:hypothetical protein PR048_023329 [Dryococelus australis]|uniref:DUF4371 domain-containing protein n=1 Tax=Dryococelus australis TaxID=614101 RepID=A0ABQ9GTS5_9NEOP|nr:hypothetical protein PR048_023329 [Dryococelus australis]
MDITDIIVKMIAKSRLYSIIFDESHDLSNKAQVSLIHWNVHLGDSNDIREDFITLIDAFGNLCEAVNQSTEIQDDILD